MCHTPSSVTCRSLRILHLTHYNTHLASFPDCHGKSSIKYVVLEYGGMSQWLRALVALPKKPKFSTHVSLGAHNYL